MQEIDTMSELEQEEEATDFLAFATLGLDSDLEDEPQSSSSSTQANGKLNREQRLQRAFQTSKDTWRAEHGLTESGVCRYLDRWLSHSCFSTVSNKSVGLT